MFAGGQHSLLIPRSSLLFADLLLDSKRQRQLSSKKCIQRLLTKLSV